MLNSITNIPLSTAIKAVHVVIKILTHNMKRADIYIYANEMSDYSKAANTIIHEIEHREAAYIYQLSWEQKLKYIQNIESAISYRISNEIYIDDEKANNLLFNIRNILVPLS